MIFATFLSYNPWPKVPGRTMPHMLRVTAGQIGNPIGVLILVKTNNRLRFSLLHSSASQPGIRLADSPLVRQISGRAGMTRHNERREHPFL